MTTGYRNLTTVCLATALAFGLAACGGSSSTAPDPQMTCEDAGGRWNADMTCTTADELAEERRTMQLEAITEAIGAAQTAVAAVDNDSTDTEVTAADTAVTNATSAISAAADVPAATKAGYTTAVNGLASRLSDAKTARMTAMNEAEMAKREAAAAMAAKLYAGINAPEGMVETYTTDDLIAGYGGTGDADIVVQIGTDPAASTPTATLKEDKKTSVAANHGWAGKRFADPAGGVEFEAMVYSNVEAPTPGKKFGSVIADATNAANGYQYQLAATATDTTVLVGELTIDGATGGTTPATRVSGPSFDHTAGTKEFPRSSNDRRVEVSGSYHGVSGTYYCTPAATSTCAARAHTTGFELGGTANADNTFATTSGTWTFKPGNAEARVMSAMDTEYSSYGWWIRTAMDGKVTVSAFHDFKGTAETDIDLPDAGTATYRGGAAGKYALSSATGGTNDSGHFTARATLEAKFDTGDTGTISGMLDNFVGADGESRDWSVKLNEDAVTNVGVIDGMTAETPATQVGTVWTIGGEAAAKSGEWSGNLREQGDDNVPGAVTGTFYSTYGNAGKMVGGFGATKE